MWGFVGYYVGCKIGNEIYRYRHCPNPYYTPPPWWHPTLNSPTQHKPTIPPGWPSMTANTSSEANKEAILR